MMGAEFERYVGHVFYENGHHAAATKGSGDYGVDLVLDGKIAVQVKRYSSPVGPGAVQEVVAGKVVYDCAEAWVVTNSTFTRAAVALAKANGVRLIAGDELQWLADNPDRTADHRARYEAAQAEVAARERAAQAEAVAAQVAAGSRKRAELKAVIDRYKAAHRTKGVPPAPPGIRQQIADRKARRDAEVQSARAKQIADWHARTGSWWRQQPDGSQPTTGE